MGDAGAVRHPDATCGAAETVRGVGAAIQGSHRGAPARVHCFRAVRNGTGDALSTHTRRFRGPPRIHGAQQVGMNHDTLRARIRLALGGDVIIGDRLPSRAGAQRYAATRGREGALVTVFPRAPAGPTPEALRSMVDRFRAAQHAAIVVPRQAIEVDGRACLVDERPAFPTILDRLQSGPQLDVRESIVVLRSIARALATLHRRGLTHGALDLDTVHLTPTGAVVSGLGSVTDGTVAGDLEALARIGYALLSGDLPASPAVPLIQHRRALPPQLHALIDSMLDPDVAKRPARAETVLRALDAVPAREERLVPSFLDGATHGARVPESAAVRLMIAAIGILLVVALVSGR